MNPHRNQQNEVFVSTAEIEKERIHKFFLDAKEYETDKHSLTGSEIKAFGAVPVAYQLYEEEEGDKPDKPISDATAVDLAGKIKHFYAVPPATFG
jgi:hypothetical protein